MTSSTPRLEVTHLCRSYAGRKVVSDVSLSILPGRVTCLLGPSGCGKSTMLRMIAGVDRQDSGRIAVDGVTISDDTYHVPPEKREIGLMFQDFALFPHLTVAQNVGFGLKNASKQEKRQRIEELLSRVDLIRFIDGYPHQLSGGEQQRVALARALAPRPRIMLMDEPFSGLDNRLRDEIRDETLTILKEEETAVLLVTHEPDEAMRMADDIALMRSGEIVQHGTPYDLYTAPMDRVALSFFSDVNLLHAQTSDGEAQTLFGSFPTAQFPDNSSVDIAFRPQHLMIDFDRAGKGPAPTAARGTAVRGWVHRARLLGGQSLVEFQAEGHGPLLKATLPGVFLPPRGTVMWLTVPRDKYFIFAKAAG
ncbi:MAG: ABC transporter ATP-binding protein [Pseudomonadota bacterium]